MRSAEELQIVASYGGGLVIDASKYMPTDLLKIAAHAAHGGASLTLRNCGHLSPNDLNSIASYGKGAVVFDFVS